MNIFVLEKFSGRAQRMVIWKLEVPQIAAFDIKVILVITKLILVIVKTISSIISHLLRDF